MLDKAQSILQKYYGYKNFRKGQKDIIDNILLQKDVLAIMPTGGGKSICYQVPALILDGLTIVISPLISLMKDQVDSIKGMGIECAYINSSLSVTEFNNVMSGIINNNYKIIYVTPERLESYEFVNSISRIKVSQIAIDEAHCVSQWGHDFRTSYRNIKKFIESLYDRPIVTAFTATASKDVRKDIIDLLGLESPEIFITGFNRENLTINIIKNTNKKEYLFKYIENNKDISGIIYAATRKDVDKIHEDLNKKGYLVGKYHAGLSDNERKNNQENFTYDRVNIMVATNAFGMGIDKPNIRYVIHYNMPQNIEGYYQEVGRAGRDGEESECILLFAPGDIQTQKYLIEVSHENIYRKNNQYKKLQQMVDLIYCNDCYRKYILNYFGESLLDNCNKCSNCLSNGEIVDKTLDAQKVLSCIYRIKRNYGSTMIIDILRGSKNKKIIQSKFNELTTYGIMKDYSNEKLKEFINTLISHSYVDLLEGTYPVIALNDKSFKVLKGEELVLFKDEKVEKKIVTENELFFILKGLRREISIEEQIPPYMIFGDGTLMEMSIKYPLDKESMLSILGVVPLKYDKFGERFINIINKYVKENNIDINSNKIIEVLEEDGSFKVISDEFLLKELIKIRIDFAKKEKCLPQMIMSKNTLKEMSGRYPLTEEHLKDIGGLGPKKIQKYGNAIIETITQYVKHNNINVIWHDKKRKKLIIDNEFRSNKEIALDMIKNNETLKHISEELEISISTILGYITEYILQGENIDLNFDLNEFYTKNEESIIMNICEKVGYEKISNIKKESPDFIKYESIRAVILKNYILI
ncbi:DNA helicase RecQ [Clostridium tarantellae]|uniref:DNA helicase RecQ n=1 Tax=Clostridium tarantellae TaxID=39493 RepID=A0A6I1MS73_9CLOT|nr:DNA helicase RecQ [Clostridium tarantellae]MPQ43741.1 DNA helicase RecQ [Clostridium tarantellae]